MKLVAMVLGFLAIAPVAAASFPNGPCAIDPLLTLGGTTPPAQGVYAEANCSDAAPVTLRVTVATAPPIPGTCQPVPAVFVLGRLVPGTGATYCAPGGEPGNLTFAVGPLLLPDEGLVLCDDSGSCTTLSGPSIARALCGDIGTLPVSVGAATVTLSCV